MRQNLIDAVYKYGDLQNGWDGEQSKAPSRDMVNQSLVLINRFNENYLPHPMLSPNGNIGFYWAGTKFYADLENDNGIFSFYSNIDQEQFIDDLTLADLTEDWFNEHIKY